MADAPDTAVSILQRPPRRLLTGFALLVSRQFIEPLAGKRLAAVLSWVSLPVQLAILMLSRSYAVCLAATQSPSSGRRTGAAGPWLVYLKSWAGSC